MWVMSPRPAHDAVLAIDQGGHSTRCLAFDACGRLLAEHREAVSETRPAPGFVEQDPAALLASLHATVDTVFTQLAERDITVCAVGLATQRSSLCCWHRDTGAALSPVISWQDTRNRELCDALQAHAEDIHARTGLMLSPHYGASKLRWLLDHLPSLEATHAQGKLCAGPLASFLLARLLRNTPCVADPTNAARTLLLNRETLDWDSHLLALFRLSADILPRVITNVADFGALPVGHADLPLRLCIGDQSAAVFAWGEPRTDTVCLNIGTGAFVLLPCDRAPTDTDGLLNSTLVRTAHIHLHALEGTINGAASALDWLAARHDTDSGKLIAALPGWLAEATNPPLFLNGISGLAAPWWRADFVSRFAGSGSESSLAGEAVAVVESIVFLAWTIIRRMQVLGHGPRAIRVSGGLGRLDGLCQRLADLGGLPVTRPTECEATARGSAWLLWQHGPGEQALTETDWRITESTEEFIPQENPPLHGRYRRWSMEMDKALENPA